MKRIVLRFVECFLEGELRKTLSLLCVWQLGLTASLRCFASVRLIDFPQQTHPAVSMIASSMPAITPPTMAATGMVPLDVCGAALVMVGYVNTVVVTTPGCVLFSCEASRRAMKDILIDGPIGLKRVEKQCGETPFSHISHIPMSASCRISRRCTISRRPEPEPFMTFEFVPLTRMQSNSGLLIK